MNKFFQALSYVIPEAEIAMKEGLSYLSAATSMRLAGRPAVTFVEFNGQPQLNCLGGALVAVELVLDGGTVQRIWLPVLDQTNQVIAADQLTVNDINTSRQRCLVKAIASVYGWGMSVYLGFDGDGGKAVKALGVNPDTALDEVAPVVAVLKEGGAPFIEWGVGLAACRVTDSTFSWRVVEWDGLPFRNVLGGLMVDVETVYQGKAQVLSLPVMDAAFNPVPADKATVFDWNKTVMRCLTKCIAFNSGYGLSVYADEFGSADADGKAKRKPAGKKSTSESEPASAAAAKPTAEAPPASAEQATPSAQAKPDAPAELEYVGRFKNVMKSRREVAGVPGLVSLFDALAVSQKFTGEQKPHCFAMLLPAVTAQATVGEVGVLLEAIKTHQAMQYLALDSRDMVAAKLTATALAASVAEGDDALKLAPGKLIEAGIAADVGDVLRLAALGNVPAETLDLLEVVLDTASA